MTFVILFNLLCEVNKFLSLEYYSYVIINRDNNSGVEALAKEKENSSGPGKIRQLNRKAILAHLRHHGNKSRSTLGPALDLSPAAVSAVVNELFEQGFLRNSEQLPETGRQGRPIALIELNPHAAYVIGLVIRPSDTNVFIDAAWADYTGNVTTLTNKVSLKTKSLDSLLKAIQTTLNNLEKNIPDITRIAGLAIGIPGVVNGDVINIAPKLTCIEGDKLIQQLRSKLPYPVSFHNDVNLAALSELHTQPRLHTLSFVYLYVYSGVGAGIVLRGQLHDGNSGWAGEIGQLRLNCQGGQGQSFEQLISIEGILTEQVSRLGHNNEGLDALIPYIDKRDKEVIAVIDEYCERLSNVLRILHAVLDLDEILIDFPSSKLFKRLRPRLELLIQDLPRQPVISQPMKGHGAALNGAALTALNDALEVVEQR